MARRTALLVATLLTLGIGLDACSSDTTDTNSSSSCPSASSAPTKASSSVAANPSGQGANGVSASSSC